MNQGKTVQSLKNGYVLTNGSEICHVKQYIPVMLEFDYLTLAHGLAQFQLKLNEALANDLGEAKIQNMIIESEETSNSTIGGKRKRSNTAHVQAFLQQNLRNATTTTTSASTTFVPARNTSLPGVAPSVSENDMDVDTSGSNFLLLNTLKVMAEKMQITQVSALLESLKKRAVNFRTILKRFGIVPEQNKRLKSVIKLANKFTGKYWIRAAQLLRKLQETKNNQTLEVRNSLTDKKALLKFSKSETEIERISLFQFLSGQAEQVLSSLSVAMRQLQNYRWPIEMINIDSLENVKQEVNEKHNLPLARLISQASKYPLTYPVTGDCEKEPCSLRFVLFIPILDENDRYQEKRVHILPTYHKGIILNDWHKLTVPREILYSQEKRIPVDYQSQECLKDYSEKDCSLCTIESTQRPASNPCLKALVQNKEPWDLCPYEKMRSPTDIVVKMSEGQWAYSDDTPGQLMERCNKSSQVYELPNTGILTLKPDCEYQITNNPISTEEIRANGIIIQDISDYPSVNQTEAENPTVERHLKDNVLIYVIVLSCLLIALILAWIISCYFSKNALRIRGLRSQRRRRRARSMPGEITSIPLITTAVALQRNNRNNPIIL